MKYTIINNHSSLTVNNCVALFLALQGHRNFSDHLVGYTLRIANDRKSFCELDFTICMFSMQLAFWDSAWDMHIVTYRNTFWLLQNLVFSVVILNFKSLKILIKSPFIKLYYWRNIFLHYVILSHIYHFRQLPVILYSYFTKINYDLWTDEWIDLLFLVSCPERALNRMFDVRVLFIAFNDFCCVLCLFF